MGTVVINGATYSGNNIVVKNDKVIIDGVEVSKGHTTSPLNIKVEGKIESLKADGNVEVRGEVGGDVLAGGNVECHNVGGDIQAGGNVRGLSVSGDVMAGGNVHIKG